MKHKINKWRQYERIKAALQRQNLTPAEYQRRINEAAKRLGV